jgi:flagellar biosynthesis protein FlhG
MFWGNKDVIAIGGGKGGIGKSTFTANLGSVLSMRGCGTVLVDADLGAANLHSITGVTYPEKTLDDFIKGRQGDLEDTLLSTPFENMRLLSSASDILSIAAPNYKQRQKLYRAINKLDTDIILFDIAAGTHSRAIDFFSLAPIGIIIVEPTPLSLENAFTFLKNLLLRHLLRIFFHNRPVTDYIKSVTDPRNPQRLLHFNDLLSELEKRGPEKIQRFREQFLQKHVQMYIVANNMRSPQQISVTEKFARIIKRYLTLDMSILGGLPYEPRMNQALAKRTPLVKLYPDSEYAAALNDIIHNLPLKKHSR